MSPISWRRSPAPPSTGAHRGAVKLQLDAAELRARNGEDRAEPFRIAAYTGLRLDELLALRWEDVDLGG